MSKLIAGCVVTVLAGVGLTQEGPEGKVPQLPQPQKAHDWLQQLAGEWECEVQMFMEPGQPPVKVKGTETVRSIGGFWIVAESKGTFQESPYTGLLTLGYDVEKRHYVGTWIDSMTGHLWVYAGRRDKSDKVLTLQTEGPCPTTPGKVSRFKEVLEVHSKDHKVFTSSVKGEDGKWTIVMIVDYRRTK